MIAKLHFYVNVLRPHAQVCRAALSEKAQALGFVETSGEKADLIVALGGDGTIFRAVHEFPDVPVLGLNLGGLGYLSSVEERDFGVALERVRAGQYRVTSRSMLAVRRMGAAGACATALNDVVVREMSGHAAQLQLAVDGRVVTQYVADGLIFATPTGSTAYSLAAGGPVLMPDSASFVVNPMYPHALGIRPLVVRDTAVFAVTAQARGNGNETKTAVFADGAVVCPLEIGATVEIVKAEQPAYLVELDGYNPYEVLARKLGWSGSNLKHKTS